MRRFGVLIVCIILAALSTFLVYRYIKAKEGEILESAVKKRVIIASQDIPEMTQIDESMITTTEIPKKYLQPEYLESHSQVVRAVAKVPIRKGEQIVGTKLVSIGRETGLAFKVPVGKRAMAIAVNNVTAVASLIKPGNYVDLLGIFDFEGKGTTRRGETVGVTLLQNILVLAVNQEVKGAIRERSIRRREKGGMLGVGRTREARTTTVCLSLSPEETQRIALAERLGSIKLTLRSPFDEERAKVEEITSGSLLPVLKKEAKKDYYKVVKPSQKWQDIRPLRSE
jgi:pilus assembly protein CpaB